MATYKCTRAFTGKDGKTYAYGTRLSSSGYYSLPLTEQGNFAIEEEDESHTTGISSGMNTPSVFEIGATSSDSANSFSYGISPESFDLGASSDSSSSSSGDSFGGGSFDGGGASGSW